MTEVCEKHGKYEAEIMEVFGLKIVSNCPECARVQEEAEKQAEAKIEMNRMIERLQKRGIEREHINASLENYKAENESEKNALESARELAEGRLKKLILLGNNGTGKTHLACALVRKLGGIRITMFELSARIRAGYSRGESELDILDELLAYPFIALDEIGRTKGSESEKNWLSYLLDKAHTRGIPLLVISNRQMARSLSADRKNEAFEFYFDNDVISRLRQNSRIVEVHGRDRRMGT